MVPIHPLLGILWRSSTCLRLEYGAPITRKRLYIIIVRDDVRVEHLKEGQALDSAVSTPCKDHLVPWLMSSWGGQ